MATSTLGGGGPATPQARRHQPVAAQPGGDESEDDHDHDDFANLPRHPVASPSAELLNLLNAAGATEEGDSDDEDYEDEAAFDEDEDDWEGPEHEEELASEDEDDSP